MNMVRRNSEIKPFYSNFLDDFLNTGLSAFEDRRGVPALNVKLQSRRYNTDDKRVCWNVQGRTE